MTQLLHSTICWINIWFWILMIVKFNLFITIIYIGELNFTDINFNCLSVINIQLCNYSNTIIIKLVVTIHLLTWVIGTGYGVTESWNATLFSLYSDNSEIVENDRTSNVYVSFTAYGFIPFRTFKAETMRIGLFPCTNEQNINSVVVWSHIRLWKVR